MDRAGFAVARVAAGCGGGYGARVAVLAGPGNNGGDGYVAAAYLVQRGAAVSVYPLAEPKSQLGLMMRERARRAGARLADWADPGPADIVVDALFGGGFRGQLPELGAWSGTQALVVAVDVPSGLSATTGIAAPGTVRATRTVTFHGPKVGHLLGEGPDFTGRLDVVDIGLPAAEPEFWLCEPGDAPIPRRVRTAHKWSAGAVLVVGGSAGIDGAALLAARAALSAGAGAVMVAAPPSAESRIRAPEIMTRAIGTGTHLAGDDAGDILDVAERFDVLVIGPGLGLDTGSLVPELLDRWSRPVVLDADGLNVLDGVDALHARTAPTVITPHAGEFGRLTGTQASYEAAGTLAQTTGVIVLLKGNPTFVTGQERWAVAAGGRELATIGTGDVLAGMIAAFWSGGLPGEIAARSAAYWHGEAGSRLAGRRTVTADRLIDAVAEILARRAADVSGNRR